MKLFPLAPALLVLVLAAACARTPRTPTVPPPTPTAIVYPATWTPEVTPLPPTATPRPPTSTPHPDTIAVLAAFERTRQLTVYYARLNMTLTDPTGAVPGAQPGVPFSVMNMEGRVNQGDAQWRLSGFFILFLGGDANKGIEFVTQGDKMYLHGPLPYFGAPEDRWYVAPRREEGNLTASLGPNNFLSEFNGTDTRLPAMRAVAPESLDNKACTKYAGDERETMDLFAQLDRSGQFTGRVGALDGVVQRASMHVWVCDDGYVHQLEMGINVTDKEYPTREASLAISLRMNDMNILVPLTVPTDAIPLSAPLLFPTPFNSNPQLVPTPFRFPTPGSTGQTD